MTEDGRVTKAVLAMARERLDEPALAARICRAYVADLDVDGAAMSVMTASAARETLGTSDATATLLEELQYTLNEGACIQAATSGVPILVGDLRDNGDAARWPVFADEVLERTDVRALFALPLQWGVVNLGVLSLYRRSPGGLDEVQWRDALGGADIAAMIMLGARTHPGGDHAAWLDTSVNSHHGVHLATGMVLAQLGVTAEEALARLRAYAFARQLLLVDVADDVVERRLVFTDDTW